MSANFLENTSKATCLPWEKSPNGYRCHVCVIREDDDTYSAVIANLPGCGSCGDSRDEAISNAKDAVLATIESYIESDREIPWDNSQGCPEGTIFDKWIVVNV